MRQNIVWGVLGCALLKYQWLLLSPVRRTTQPQLSTLSHNDVSSHN